MSEFPETENAAAVQAPAALPKSVTWFHRLTSVLLVIFCFELGLFLLVYPWTASWNQNYFAWIIKGPFQLPWHTLWVNPWLRGAVSGMGLVNLWLAVSEVFHMFSRRSDRI